MNSLLMPVKLLARGSVIGRRYEIRAVLGHSTIGKAPQTLLPRVEAELRLTGECVPMVLSLKAELLARLGRHDEAERTARDAWARMRKIRFLHTTPYAHRDLVRERYERITGRVSEAS